MNYGVGWVVNHRRGQRQVFRAFADAQKPRFFRLPARTPSTGSTRLPYGTFERLREQAAWGYRQDGLTDFGNEPQQRLPYLHPQSPLRPSR